MSTGTDVKRANVHRKKPRFIRQESWRLKRVKSGWRRPRGKTSKMRRQQRGWPRLVKVGYGKPKSLRGLHPSGLREIMVNQLKELASVDPKKEVVRIARNVGERKRLAIIEKAKELEIRVLNPVGIRKPEEEAAAPEVEEPSVQEVKEEVEPEGTPEELSPAKDQGRVEKT